MNNTCLSVFFFFFHVLILDFCYVQNYNPDHKEVLNIVPTPLDRNSIGYASKRLNGMSNEREKNAHMFDSENKPATLSDKSQKSTAIQDVLLPERSPSSQNDLQQQPFAVNSPPNTSVQQFGLSESVSSKEENVIQTDPSKEKGKLFKSIQTVPSPWKENVSERTDVDPENHIFVFDDEWDKVFQLLESGYKPSQNIWLKFRKYIDS